MNLNTLRVLNEMEASIILIISLLIVGFLVWRFFKNRIYIPFILSIYGGIYCWLIVFVFSEGYSGIVFVLIGYLFILFIGLSLLAILFRHFKSTIKS